MNQLRKQQQTPGELLLEKKKQREDTSKTGVKSPKEAWEDNKEKEIVKEKVKWEQTTNET